MIKKLLLLSFLTILTLPAMADEVNINMTPANKFSGMTNKSNFKVPPLSASDLQYEEGMVGMDDEGEINFSHRPVSARQIVNQDPDAVRRAPMNYSNFPQNYDSSNSMLMMQGGMGGMFAPMGF